MINQVPCAYDFPLPQHQLMLRKRPTMVSPFICIKDGVARALSNLSTLSADATSSYGRSLPVVDEGITPGFLCLHSLGFLVSFRLQIPPFANRNKSAATATRKVALRKYGPYPCTPSLARLLQAFEVTGWESLTVAGFRGRSSPPFCFQQEMSSA